jgi:hypothetical protein
MLTVDDLLLLVEPFCKARGIAASRLSILLFNDGKRLKTMMEKRGDISSRLLRSAFQWFSDNWPEGTQWPADVPRPEPSAATAVQAA